jgi:hypothetical protein
MQDPKIENQIKQKNIGKIKCGKMPEKCWQNNVNQQGGLNGLSTSKIEHCLTEKRISA